MSARQAGGNARWALPGPASTTASPDPKRDTNAAGFGYSPLAASLAASSACDAAKVAVAVVTVSLYIAVTLRAEPIPWRLAFKVNGPATSVAPVQGVRLQLSFGCRPPSRTPLPRVLMLVTRAGGRSRPPPWPTWMPSLLLARLRVCGACARD